jgi:hypothetical protein
VFRPHHPCTLLFKEGVNNIHQWLLTHHTPPDLAIIIKYYLPPRPRLPLHDITSDASSSYYAITKIQDAIGFDNLIVIVGRLPSVLVHFMSPILRRLNKRGLTSDLWAQKLSRELILFTHRQWSYQNSTVNYKSSKGKTVQEHDAIDSHVRSLLSLDPLLLPQHHRHLLLQKDLLALNSGTSTSKQFWIAEVTTALAEAALMKKLRKKWYISAL